MMIQVSQNTSSSNSSASNSSQSSADSDFEKILQENSSSSSDGATTNENNSQTNETTSSEQTDTSTETESGDTEITDAQRELMAALMMNPEMIYREVEEVGTFGLENQEVVVEEVQEIDLLDNGELNLGNQDESQLMSDMGEEVLDLGENLDVQEENSEILEIPDELLLETPVETEEVTVELPKELVDTQEETTEEEVEVEAEASVTEEAETTETVKVQPVKENAEQEDTGAESDVDAELVGQNQQGNTLFDKVESTPIKVAETVNTQDPDMDAQMAKIIQTAVDDGENTVIIRMTPESLGTVTAEITQTAEGTLRVVLQAADDVATALLKNHVNQLVQALQSTGQTVTVEIAASEEAEQSDQEQADGQEKNQEQQQGEGKNQDEQEFVYNEDFMQQLRLGLAGFDLEVK